MKGDRTAFDPAEYIDDFRVEATEHLNALEVQLLKLEQDPADPEPIRAMFLSAHTIKGGAAMLELANVLELAHAMEEVLEHLRDHRRLLDGGTADLLSRGVDALRQLVSDSVPGGTNADSATAEVAAALVRYARERVAMARVPDAQEADAHRESASAEATRVLLFEDSPDRADVGDDAAQGCRL